MAIRFLDEEKPSRIRFLDEEPKSEIAKTASKIVQELTKVTISPFVRKTSLVPSFIPTSTQELVQQFLPAELKPPGFLERKGREVGRAVEASEENIIGSPFAGRFPRLTAGLLAARQTLAGGDLTPSSFKLGLGPAVLLPGGPRLRVPGISPKLAGEISALQRIGQRGREEATLAQIAMKKVPQVSKQTAIEFQLNRRMQQASGLIKSTTDRIVKLNERSKILLGQAEEVQKTGTLVPEVRPIFRGVGPPSPRQTLRFKISESDVRRAQAEVVTAARQYTGLVSQIKDLGDIASKNVVQAAEASLNLARQRMNDWANRFQKIRFAAGRTVKAFDRAVPEDVIQAFRSADIIIDGVTTVKQRLPLTTSILEFSGRFLRNPSQITQQDFRNFTRDLIDHFRFGLFPVTSFSLDFFGNISELGAQVGGGVGRDIIHAIKGKPTIPSLQGFIRALRFKPLPQPISQELPRTAIGEPISGVGIFTLREGIGAPGSLLGKLTKPISTVLDYTFGGPLYLKGFIDTTAKRIGAMASLWRDAILEADRLALKGLERKVFYEKFFRDIPQESVRRSILQAQKAGFSRELSSIEREFTSSTASRLLIDVFGNWPFQFTRWGAEVLGYNKELLGKLAKGKASSGEIAEWLAKSSTGWGGLYLVDKLYDRVDFNSMEYVHPDGNRTRLSGRSPIPEGLFLLSIIRGDMDRASGALRFSSFPFAKVMFGEGGLIGSVVKQLFFALQNPQNNPRAVKRELEEIVNKAIPGQAVLSAIKTIFDPVIRQRVGANLPFISRLLPPVISPTTGEPLQPRQRIPGLDFEIPTIAGVPIPGARRILDPVQQLLSRFGLLIFRGPRIPIAGFPPAQVPDEIRQEWEIEFGKERNRILTRFIKDRFKGRIENVDRLDLNQFEAVRDKIQELDSLAARVATLRVSSRHGGFKPPQRQPGLRERRAPVAFKRRIKFLE